MSSIYITEPSTSGRIIIETTYGPLDIQLFSRECPLTCKFFLQLCIDQFYDNMTFHRIIPNLLIQTGLIRQQQQEQQEQQPDDESEQKKEKIMMKSYRQKIQADYALERRKYELNTRIQFNHRGQVAMALSVNSEDDNDDHAVMQPQFFITTTDCEYLNGQHVVFGTIGSGSPTIFNALRINTQTDINEATNTPVDLYHAPRITSIKIIENPFASIVIPQPISIVPWKMKNDDNVGSGDAITKKRKQRKGKLDVNVLSFGDDVGDGDDYNTNNNKKKNEIIPATALTHKEESVGVTENNNSNKSNKDDAIANNKATNASTTNNEVEINGTMEKEEHQQLKYNEEDNYRNDNSKNEKVRNEDDKHDEMKNKEREDPNHERKTSSGSYSAIEQRRANYTKGRQSKASNKRERDEETMARLLVFKRKVYSTTGINNDHENQEKSKDKDGIVVDDSLAARMARRAQQEHQQQQANINDDDGGDDHYHGQVLDNSDDEKDSSNWLKTKFVCKKLAGGNNDGDAADGRHTDDYEVIDDKYHHNKKRHNRHRDDQHHHHSINSKHEKDNMPDSRHRRYHRDDRHHSSSNDKKHKSSNHHHDRYHQSKHPSNKSDDGL